MLAVALSALAVIGLCVGTLVWLARGWLGERKRAGSCALKLNDLAHVNDDHVQALTDAEDEYGQAMAANAARTADLQKTIRRLQDANLKFITEADPTDPAVRHYLDGVTDELQLLLSKAAEASSGDGGEG